jgi:hypothetical protein
MPKEVILVRDTSIGVHWYNPELSTGEYIEPIVAVSINCGNPVVIDGEEFDRVFFNFEDPESVERHIRALRRAKRKAFPKE